MKLHIKELILDEIVEHYINGEQDLMIAYNRASYAFACWSEESDEDCRETFNASLQDVYDAQFDINDIKMSEILEALDNQGIDIFNQ